MTFDHLVILMSTYNGERFLKQQLDSIVQQDYENWDLIIRDDGSTDSTQQIIDYYVLKDNRIHSFPYSAVNRGPANSFLMMLTSISAPLFMFADQDDIWYPNKVGLTVGSYMQQTSSASVPTLVFTNMDTIDASGTLIQSNIVPENARVSVNTILVTNIVTGCTVLINKSLADRIRLSDTRSIVMHDWWMAMIAAFLGNVVYLPTATIGYRQHGDNAVGVNHSFRSRINKALNYSNQRKLFSKQMAQIKLLDTRFGKNLSVSRKVELDSLISIQRSKRFLSKFSWLLRHRAKKTSLVGTLSFYYLFLTTNVE